LGQLKNDAQFGAAMKITNLAEIRDKDFWRQLVITGSPEQVATSTRS